MRQLLRQLLRRWIQYSLSILYLRCALSIVPGGWVWPLQLSILYLRCRKRPLRRLGCQLRRSFNSLFEMPMRIVPWKRGSDEMLSILYLRCYLSYGYDYRPPFIAFQFSIWDAGTAGYAVINMSHIFQFSIWDAKRAWVRRKASQRGILSILYLRCP